MERWIEKKQDFAESEKVETFLIEVAQVCKKHNLSLGHEDREGSFIVVDYNDDNQDWLMCANDSTK